MNCLRHRFSLPSLKLSKTLLSSYPPTFCLSPKKLTHHVVSTDELLSAGTDLEKGQVFKKKVKWLAGPHTRALEQERERERLHNKHISAKQLCSESNEEMNTLETVVSKLKNLAPLSLAGSWDNVGLLVEPSPPKYISKVLLTNDLTIPVMEEAKEKIVDLIISYHPPIFVKLKCLTQKNWKERLVVDCIENRIAVFSPHTSYDAVEGGVNDWLLSAFDVDKRSVTPIEATEEFVDDKSHILEAELEPSQFKEFMSSITSCLSDHACIKKAKSAFSTHVVKSGTGSSEIWIVRQECNQRELSAMVNGLVASHWKGKYSVLPLSKLPKSKCGMGRRANLKTPKTLEFLIEEIKIHLGLTHLSVAKAIETEVSEISTIAVCAGSGSSVLRGVRADLLLTGEMSHHEVLDAVHNGSNVILCHHSNTERGYLKKLQMKLAKLFGNSIEIYVSEADRDPLEIL